MKVYVVDRGAYENNYIDKIFLRQKDAEGYVAQLEEEYAQRKASNGWAVMDDCCSWTEYEVEQALPIPVA